MKKVLLMVTLTLFPRLLVAQELDIKSLLGEEWYGVYMNGQKAGYSVNTVAQDKSGAVTVTEDAHFRVSMMGTPQDMRIYCKRAYSAAGDLVSVEQKIKDDTLEARVEGDSMLLVTEVGGAHTETKLPKPKESLRDALKQAELASKNAKVGDQLAYSYFEPMYKKELEGVSRIESIEERVLDGVKTKVFKIRSTLPAMGLDTDTYVTENGKTLEDHLADMIVMRLEPKEIAQDVTYSNDVIVANAAVADRKVENPRDRDALHLHLFGPLNSSHFFNEERQQFTPEKDYVDFTSKKISLDGFKAARLPIQNAEVETWIKPTLLVQSNDPKLIAKAHEIVGGEKDALAISSKLCHWVFANVHTTFSARLSNALEVLEHPEGDCTEHSILFIGLARAAGLPAREAAGLIYVQGDKPAFYFHQWASVWVGKWIDVDPTFDQPTADVTHIKLAMGDLFEQAKLIPTIGKIRINVIE